MDARAGKGQVAHRIEQLVADEFVRRPQALRVHHAATIDYHGILQAAATG